MFRGRMSTKEVDEQMLNVQVLRGWVGLGHGSIQQSQQQMARYFKKLQKSFKICVKIQMVIFSTI